MEKKELGVNMATMKASRKYMEKQSEEVNEYPKRTDDKLERFKEAVFKLNSIIIDDYKYYLHQDPVLRKELAELIKKYIDILA